MNHRVVVTGAMGLVGSALTSTFSSRGIHVVPLDIKANGEAYGDVRDNERVRTVLQNADGIVHLAAVSRVIWGERDPEACFSTNVGGLRNILESAASSSKRPWLIFASSREVYGQPESLPATEDCPVRPVNVYGRSKVEGEKMVTAAQQHGMRACVVRLSNVFGSAHDHPDRVVPAFVRGALAKEPLRVEGMNHTFDFTHVDDVCAGIVALGDLLASGEKAPPPVHFVSGIPTTLGELAALTIRLAGAQRTGFAALGARNFGFAAVGAARHPLGGEAPYVARSTIQEAPARNFDVARFWGNPARAESLLGWKPRVPLSDGLARLMDAFRALERNRSEEVSP